MNTMTLKDALLAKDVDWALIRSYVVNFNRFDFEFIGYMTYYRDTPVAFSEERFDLLSADLISLLTVYSCYYATNFAYKYSVFMDNELWKILAIDLFSGDELYCHFSSLR